MSNLEQALSIIKPDAVERNLDNEIKEMFKNKGFNILKEKNDVDLLPVKIMIKRYEYFLNIYIPVFSLISKLNNTPNKLTITSEAATKYLKAGENIKQSFSNVYNKPFCYL